MKNFMFHIIRHHVDFCVVGGGLAGMCAAIAAARAGAKVVLINDRPVLGGNCSSEIRMWVCGADGGNNRETGLIEEIQLESLYRNPDKKYGIWDGILYGKVIAEKNITLLLNCSVCDGEMSGDKLKLVRGWQTTTQQWHEVEASLFADCSGDSVLAPITGAEFRVGREAAAEFGEKTSQVEADRQTMGMSCLLQCRKTDRKSTFIAPDWAVKMTPEVIRLRKPNMSSESENFWYLELGGNRNSIDDTEKVRDELVALAYGMFDYIKNSGEVPDADCWELDFLGFLPGKRESRRMVGEYIMTQGDVLSGGDFEDTVAYGGWPLDDHHPDGFYHAGNPNVWGKTPSPYGIPYRCLYSVNIANLFFAGRNISMTHAAMSSARVMATCATLGEAVGTAAAIAIREKADPRDIYHNKAYLLELQQKLMENGCFLPRFKRELPEFMGTASLLCEGAERLDNLRNGIDRNNATYGEGDFGAVVPLGAEITYRFRQPEQLERVHLAFDSDLPRATLPGNSCERMHTMRANIFPDSPTMYIPKTLVKKYTVSGITADGEKITLYSDDNNIRQCVNIPISGKFREISLSVIDTWGDDKEKVHIFSFDVK